MGKENLISLLFGFAYPSAMYLNGAFIGTFCRRKKCPKTPLQIYEAIFAMQNRPKNSPIIHKAYYPSLFLALLLNRFALKHTLQKHIAIGCKRTKGLGIGVAQRWRGSFISGAYAVSNCLMFLKREFWDTFLLLSKGVKRCNETILFPWLWKSKQNKPTDSILYTIVIETTL